MNTNNHKILSSGMAEDAHLSSENMSFRDNNSGVMDERKASMDPTRNLGFTSDTTLNQFFSRPIRIAEYQWSTNSALFQRIDPWSLFWDNARNIDKIRNFQLLKCTLKVKIVLNGNAFYYGRLIAAYEPLADLDNTSPQRTWLEEDFVRGSQRMHVYANPTCSEGGSLHLPMFLQTNAMSIPDRGWSILGNLVIASINNLQHANGGTEPVTVTVFAWAEDVSYSIPTQNVPEMDEHDIGVVSRPASAIARFAQSLANVPYIGPFAMATQIGATAVGTIAKLFGYSAPNELTYSVMIPNARHSLAVVDTKQATNKTSVDSKQELTICPKTTGIGGDDELPIASIAGRESYLTQFAWNVNTDSPDKILFSTYVNPGIHRRVNTGSATEIHMPACCFASQPFDYWRGTMRFRFQVVSSNFHKGRLRIVYNPNDSTLDPEFNTVYTTIHDIADEKDFTIDVGWAQNKSYQKVFGLDLGDIPFFGPLALPTSSEYSNGTLSVYVLNPLVTAGTVVSNISINVFISMLDDFEVASPNDLITFVRFRPELQNVPEMDIDTDTCAVVDPPVAAEMADVQIEDDNVTKLFFGEVIASFRQMLKRSYHHEASLLPEVTEMTLARINRSSFPMYGGYVSADVPNSPVVPKPGSRFYLPVETTMLNYLARAYVGWRGSIRWTYDQSHTNRLSTDFAGSLSFKYSRGNSYTNTESMIPVTNFTTAEIVNGLNEQQRGSTTRGCYLGTTDVNPIMSFEIPFYSTLRFLPTAFEPTLGVETEGPALNVNTVFTPSSSQTVLSFYDTYCSAGEDFNFFFYNGMPPVYFEEFY